MVQSHSSLTRFCVNVPCSGGVMLVHDIRNNKTQVIDFRETAPSSLSEEMLEADFKLKVGYCIPVALLLHVTTLS